MIEKFNKIWQKKTLKESKTMFWDKQALGGIPDF